MHTKKCENLYVISIFILVFLFFPKAGVSGIVPPWSFSFDCGREYVLDYDSPDWNDFQLCEDGVGPYLNASSPDGNYMSVLYAANNPLGTGLGSRQWMAAGKNQGTPGIGYEFENSLKEFWLRWYFRWEKGFWWGTQANKKIAYFDTDLGVNGQWIVKHNNLGTKPVWGQFCFFIGKDGRYIQPEIEFGWDELMVNGDASPEGDGHKASDGEWHYMEIHVKYESAIGVADGVAEMWVDGVQIISVDDVEFGNTSGASYFKAPNNQDNPGVTSEMWLDIDDFALSTTGYIGPLIRGSANSGTVSMF